MNLKSSACTAAIAAATWATLPGGAAASPGLAIDPVAHRPATGSVGIGYYAAGPERVGYRGLLGTTHTIERESAGVLITASYGDAADDSTVPVPPGTAPSSAPGDGEADPGARGERAWTTLWLQVPTDAASTLEGSSPLDERALDGRSFTLGGAVVVGSERGGVHLFAAGTFVDESVSFEADGRAASGTLSGSETAVGAGVSRTFADRLTLSTGFRQTFSSLEFERAVDVGTPDFPADLSATDTVERRKRTAWLAGATLRLFDGVFLDAQASYRDEVAGSLAISVGF